MKNLEKRIATWFQIPAGNLDRATRFYATILGARFHAAQNEFGKHAVFAFEDADKDAITGELIESAEYKPCLEGTLIYLNAPRGVQEALAKVETAGGKILKPKTQIGNAGFIGVIQDSEGNKIGLHSVH